MFMVQFILMGLKGLLNFKANKAQIKWLKCTLVTLFMIIFSKTLSLFIPNIDTGPCRLVVNSKLGFSTCVEPIPFHGKIGHAISFQKGLSVTVTSCSFKVMHAR